MVVAWSGDVVAKGIRVYSTVSAVIIEERVQQCYGRRVRREEEHISTASERDSLSRAKLILGAPAAAHNEGVRKTMTTTGTFSSSNDRKSTGILYTNRPKSIQDDYLPNFSSATTV